MTTVLYSKEVHCQSCVALITETLSIAADVQGVRVDLLRKEVRIAHQSNESPEQLASRLSPLLSPHGYSLTVAVPPEAESRRSSEYFLAVAAAAVLTALFVFLQKSGIIHASSFSEVTYPAAFVIGLVASLSTCLAVVGGFLLSVSATYAHESGTTRPQILFHVGRLIAFFLFGGIIGAIGTAFTLSAGMSATLSIAIGLVMVVLALKLLDLMPAHLSTITTLPPSLSAALRRLGGRGGAVVEPFVLGATTFFLPCGFTQSMQVYTLSAGGFLPGALTMTVFALGTLPMLALISVSSVRFAETRFAGVFFKAAGFLVLLFALLGFYGALVTLGILPPLLPW